MKRERWLLAYPTPTEDSPVGLVPLSIMQPGAYFEAQGHEVLYWDQRYDEQGEFDEAVLAVDHVGVSCFTGRQSAYAADLLERAKHLKPSVTTHVGGHHARLCTEDVKREPFVDQVWPQRWLGEDLWAWSPGAQRLWKRGDVQYQTSRGCSYNCQFCCLRSEWIPSEMSKVERELTLIAELRGGLDFVSITDPNAGQAVGRNSWLGAGEGTFKLDRVQRMKDFGAITRKLGIKWDGNLRSDYMTPEYRDAIAESGCVSLEFGAESGDDWFLRNVVRKGHGTDAIKRANQLFQGSGVSVMNSFIYNLPRETPEQWRHTMEMIDWLHAECPDSRVSVFKFAPYPGGRAYKDAVEGVDGYPKFTPPTTMKGWGTLKLTTDPVYWCAGMCFRLDNSRKNFPGDDWALIEPYITLARKLWAERRPQDFPGAEVEALVKAQVEKNNKRVAEAA